MTLYHMIGFIAVSLLIVQACTLNTPITFHDGNMEELCEEGPQQYTWKGETKQFTVYMTDDPDQLYEWCGDNALACTNGAKNKVYVPQGRTCTKLMAHELNHVFGQDWVDA